MQDKGVRPMQPAHDVVIIGSGINGLSAAALLAVSGKKVLVLESNNSPGGAIRTEQITAPGFHHDLFAMNLGLFAGGAVMAKPAKAPTKDHALKSRIVDSANFPRTTRYSTVNTPRLPITVI